MSSIGLAVIGAGYWGPNLVRSHWPRRNSAWNGCVTWI